MCDGLSDSSSYIGVFAIYDRAHELRDHTCANMSSYNWGCGA